MIHSRFKSRAWNEKRNIMFYSDEVDIIFNITSLGVDIEVYPSHFSFEKETEVYNEKYSIIGSGEGNVLIQCIGLKDKNGEYVFEKDYLLYGDDIFRVNYDVDNARFIFSIWMEEKEFDEEIGREKIERCFMNIHDFLMNCEVIGNVYENKELLTKEN